MAALASASPQPAFRVGERETGVSRPEARVYGREQGGRPVGGRSARDGVLERAIAGRGEALRPSSQQSMATLLGTDLSPVRVHHDELAAGAAASLDAAAFVVGRDIVFGKGQYRPDTEQGQRLLAHELVHTVQQGMAPAPALLSDLDVSGVTDATEGEARAFAASAFAAPARRSLRPSRVPPRIARQQGQDAAATVTASQRDALLAAFNKALAEAATAPDKWHEVAVRLNGFNEQDIRRLTASLSVRQIVELQSAVNRDLAGWPAQRALLAALAAGARSRGVSLRPSGAAIWAAYSDVSYGSLGRDQVWEKIGGSVGKRFAGGDTCTARVSYALNRGGDAIAGHGTLNDSRVTFAGKVGDGMNYIVWAPSMQGYLTSRWGRADGVLHDRKEAEAFQKTLASGRVAVFAGPGHAGVMLDPAMNKTYTDPHVFDHPQYGPYMVWTLP